MKQLKKSLNLNSIAVIGNYMPRMCGIATFTHDLCDALALELGDAGDIEVLAMDDKDDGYAYPERVKYQLRDNLHHEYLKAADFLNVHQYDAIILQHEYGIFGGQNGRFILTLIKNLNMPLITTLHTILEKPSDEEKKIVQELAEYSESMVSLSKKGIKILKEVYGIPESKISFVHHGIPDVGFEDPCFHKETFGVEDRKVILTFGLLHPGKGIEYAISAMPKVIEKCPDAIYIILGATHPNILKDSGDAYRQSLLQLVNKLGLKKHVQFINKFVDLKSLCQYIGASDIYITPYLGKEQISSGTLAYTIGAGKAVISTPYYYAEEILAKGRGKLVDFCNHEQISAAIIEILNDEQKRNSMRMKAYQFGRSMIWKEVARRYISITCEILDRGIKKQKFKYIKAPAKGSLEEFPQPKLDHLRTLTDNVGIIQHATYSIPDRNHGYCTDDNARALIVTGMYYSLYKDESVIPLTNTYLAFMLHAFNNENNKFRNFMSYDRKWLEDAGSEDSQGRAILGLGATVKYAGNESIRHLAAKLFLDGLKEVDKLTYPRAIAFTIVGIHYYLEIYSGYAKVRKLREELSFKLFEFFSNDLKEEWPWFENTVTYANSIIPHALILSGQWIPAPKIFDKGIKILRWLIKIQTADEGHFSFIGNSGWLKKGGKKSNFDQQPIEAMGMSLACKEAYRATNDKYWLKEAKKSMNWFFGRNDLNCPLYDFKTGGGYDGLEHNGTNQNQGAESTLSGLISILNILEAVGEDTLITNTK